MRIKMKIEPRDGRSVASGADIEFEPDVWLKSMTIRIEDNALVIKSVQFLGGLDGLLRVAVESNSARDWGLEPLAQLDVRISSPIPDDDVILLADDLEIRLLDGKMVLWTDFYLVLGPDSETISAILILAPRHVDGDVIERDFEGEYADCASPQELLAAVIPD